MLLALLTPLSAVSQFEPQIEIDSVMGLRDAIRIAFAGDNGVHIRSTGSEAIQIDSAGQDGVRVVYAGDDGLSVSYANDNGLFVVNAGGHSMNIQGNKSASTLTGHIGLIYNRNTGTNADALAVKLGTTGNPGATNNFITFYDGSDDILGEVQGNGSGNVCYTTGGCDYAEYLPVQDPLEAFSPGDVVGVYDGHISKQTTNAHRVMVITDQAAMIGNKPTTPEDETDIIGYETVSFIGQVRTKVRGPVRAGDWIVASEHEDGTGVAVAPKDVGLHDQIVGRAWENSSDPEIKRINTVVGLDQNEALVQVIKSLEQRIRELEKENNSINTHLNQ